MLIGTFKEFLPQEELPIFFDTVSAKWSVCCSWFRNNTTLFTFENYPNIPWMLKNIAHLLEWYIPLKEKREKDESHVSTNTKTLQTEPVGVELVSTVNKTEGNSAGYTYPDGLKYNSVGKINLTYEDKWVEMVKTGNTVDLERLKKVLLKKAVDYTVSEARVKSLLESGTHD